MSDNSGTQPGTQTELDPSATANGTEGDAPTQREPEQAHIPADFVDKYINPPADLDYNGTPIAFRLACNVKIQAHNAEQLSLSMHHMTDPVAFPQPGKPQEAYYGYSPVELFSFANDDRYQKYHENLMGEAGLPQHLLAAISTYRMGNPAGQPNATQSTSSAPVSSAPNSTEPSAKEKDKAPATWKNSGGPVKLSRLILGSRPVLTYPNEYLFAAKHLIPIPLVALRTKVIKDFINKHSQIPMKKRNAPAPTDNGKPNTMYFIDNDVLHKKLGEDNTSNVPFTAWCDAMHNFLQIIKFLCDADDSTWYDNWYQHVEFFKNADNAAENYEIWFPLERDFAEQIREHQGFDADAYTSRLLNAVDNAARLDDSVARIQKLEEQLVASAKPPQAILSGFLSRQLPSG
ncbi:hypothetical protein FISHEDRAFT_59257 [Fistulina hepatica ATCC 64428]|uniref:Uncharacterized protein n=1 Tax=Fistulina hepatica ATCC 64428 TaxID=1128425 RepID=A0A0D7ADQ8_9AGAR|nr:hypothetical protein FISHEDRAFT_59257 [Fistulina hepatica ATCC 64428]